MTGMRDGLFERIKNSALFLLQRCKEKIVFEFYGTFTGVFLRRLRGDARTIRARYETRVGSPLDFQPERVSAPSCLRALRFKRFGRSSRCARL